jgi:uncharacterized protein YqjF (DUF2071 family)
MNTADSLAVQTRGLSTAARQRLRSQRGEPLLIADWERVLMIHFEVDAVELQRATPYELDLWEGRAFVSLVAFTIRGLRLRWGGRLGAWLLRPIATHGFLNVRTYVRHADEPGIQFLAEWLTNRLSVALGPTAFSLPYRLGRIQYKHHHETGTICGEVEDAITGSPLAYRVASDPDGDYHPCATGSISEWLMERYTAFNCVNGKQRFFRVWHQPWPQKPVEVEVFETRLLEENWPWFRASVPIGANYSPGVEQVWMGRPHRA